MFGLHKDGNTYFLAKIRKKRRGTLEIKKLLSSTNVKQLYNTKNSPFVSGLRASDILINSSQVKVPQKSKIDKVLSFKAESLSFIHSDQAVDIPVVHKRQNDSADVLFFTTTQDVIKNHISELNQKSLDPSTISTIPLALVRYAKSQVKELTTILIFHLGLNESTLVLMDNNMPHKAYSIEIGLSDLEQAFREDNTKITELQDINFNQFDSKKHAQLNALLCQFKAKISHIFYSLEHKNESPLSLLKTGQCENSSSLINFLFEDLMEHIVVLPPSKMEKKSPKLKEYAIPIGLAFDALASDEHSVQFRKKQFTPEKVLKRRALQVIFFLLFSFIISLSGYLLFSQRLSNSYSNLEKTADQAIRKDNIMSYREVGSGLQNQTLEGKLRSWSYVLKKEAKKFPYFFRAPKVIDILSWIQRHPILLTSKKNRLESFQYELEKYPKIGSLNAPYLVKIKLVLKIDSPVAARSFHEEILSGKGPAIPKEQPSWIVHGDLYETTFYVKPGYQYD